MKGSRAIAPGCQVNGGYCKSFPLGESFELQQSELESGTTGDFGTLQRQRCFTRLERNFPHDQRSKIFDERLLPRNAIMLCSNLRWIPSIDNSRGESAIATDQLQRRPDIRIRGGVVDVDSEFSSSGTSTFQER